MFFCLFVYLFAFLDLKLPFTSSISSLLLGHSFLSAYKHGIVPSLSHSTVIAPVFAPFLQKISSKSGTFFFLLSPLKFWSGLSPIQLPVKLVLTRSQRFVVDGDTIHLFVEVKSFGIILKFFFFHTSHPNYQQMSDQTSCWVRKQVIGHGHCKLEYIK